MGNAENATVWFAVINGYAASKKAGARWKKAEKLLNDKGVRFHGTKTGKAGNAAELTFDACLAGYRRFIAVGGDGTVHDVLNGIAGFVDWCKASGRPAGMSAFTLGVIPLGSGNDWIRSLGISNSIPASVDVIMRGETMRQDVVRVSSLDPYCLPDEREVSVSYMVNVGGVGLDARVCGRVNAKKKEGKWGRILYVTSLIDAISKRVPSDVRVLCDGREVFEGAFLSIAFGIGRYSGGGMRQTPAAVLDDGLLDMTVIPDIALGRIAREVLRLFTGTFLKVPELTVCRGKTMTVLSSGAGGSEPVEVDGEVVGKIPVRLEVLDDQINILVSSNS